MRRNLMYNYPLKFKIDSDLRILDSGKTEILYRPQISESAEKGKSACTIFSDKSASQPLYTTLRQNQSGKEILLIKTLGNTLLGRLVAESEHIWKVLDERDILVATIQENGAWKKSCLVALLTLPFSDDDFWMKIIAPRRFSVEINDIKVLGMKENVEYIHDNYTLKKCGEFSEREEVLLLVSLMMVV
ncbi:MAG TPA: hypothetical protein VFF78_06995 [Anaerolineaceae bacterium]|nr:hypothetical protein [Anaerolineaceae bacterium]